MWRRGSGAVKLLIIAVSGSCRVHLDDGRAQDTVALDDPARALYVEPWIWHELTDFAPETAVVVIASSLYEDADYLRDYEAFRREIAGRTA